MRILTFSGHATGKESSLLVNTTTPDGEMRSRAYSDLTSNGWGVFSLSLTRNILGSTVNFGYINYDLVIKIEAPDNENPERVRQGIAAALNNGAFKNTSIALIGDDRLAGGNITPTYNEAGASYNQGASLESVLNNFSLGAGVSTPIVLAGCVVLLALYLKR